MGYATNMDKNEALPNAATEVDYHSASEDPAPAVPDATDKEVETFHKQLKIHSNHMRKIFEERDLRGKDLS